MRFERYIFICTNERADDHPRGSCGKRGGIEIVEEFKHVLRENNLGTKIRVTKSGCMELCEIGPNVMIHPDNIWYMKVKPEDVKEIVESHIIGGKPVERLFADYSVFKK